MKYILGIETSCDDTSAAVVSEDFRIQSNVVSSQYAEHAPYMGVVPELACRAHLQNMPLVYSTAMDQAGITLEDLAAVAVTKGPGLIGSLMVGVNFAKGLVFGSKLPLVGVNHIRGHVAALFLEYRDMPLPAIALIVSGGHTHLLYVDEDRSLTLLTKSRDDAAGEAFDKLSKMLDLGFPGGPMVDQLARDGDPTRYNFSMPKFSDGSKDYSFSGLKSAAARFIEKEPEHFRQGSRGLNDLCASFQAAVVHQLLHRVKLGVKKEKTCSLLLGGGVACNSGLRHGISQLGEKLRLPVFITSPKLSTDNAAMIAAEGWSLFKKGQFMELNGTADISLKPYDTARLL